MPRKHAIYYAGALNQLIVRIIERWYLLLECNPLTQLETLWYSNRNFRLPLLLVGQIYPLKNWRDFSARIASGRNSNEIQKIWKPGLAGICPGFWRHAAARYRPKHIPHR